MTSYFTNTKVNVYKINMESPNAFALPLMNYGANPKIVNALFKIPIIGQVFHTLIFSIESIIRGILLYNKNKNIETSFDTINNKATLNIPIVNIFVSDKLLSMLDDKEIIAVLMHEVGHNTVIIQSILLELQNSFLYASLISLGYVSTQAYYDDSYRNTSILLCILVILALVLKVCKGKEYEKLHELHSDDFAILMGFGKELISALKKLDKYSHKLFKDEYIKWESSNREDNKVDMTSKKEIDRLKLLEKQYKESMAKIDPHLKSNDRIRYINTKIDEYNKNKSNNPILYQSQSI